MRTLEGVKVLDFTFNLAAPVASMLLADMGCDVVKIEAPKTGDFFRLAQRPKIAENCSYLFFNINRNKKNIVLNLANPKGKEVALKLAKSADVVMENFRPGVMKRLGLDHESILKMNPKVIYASLTGYGYTGPYADRPGYDLIAKADSGWMTAVAPEGGPPVAGPNGAVDTATGVYMAFAVAAALYRRTIDQKSERIDISLFDVSSFYIALYGTGDYFIHNRDVDKWWIKDEDGTLRPGHAVLAPFEGFQTKDGKWVAVAAITNDLWSDFCHALGLDNLIKDERFATPPARTDHKRELRAIIKDIFLKKTRSEVIKILEEAEVPCAPIRTSKEALEHPQMKARNMLVEVPFWDGRKFKIVGQPAKFLTHPAEEFFPIGPLGAQTEEVLRELGYSSEQIEQMRKEGVI